MRVKASVVGQHEIPERRHRGHECPWRTERQEETRPEEAQHEDHLRSDLALPKHRERCSSDRKSTRLNSSHSQISYAVFCLKKKKKTKYKKYKNKKKIA